MSVHPKRCHEVELISQRGGRVQIPTLQFGFVARFVRPGDRAASFRGDICVVEAGGGIEPLRDVEVVLCLPRERNRVVDDGIARAEHVSVPRHTLIQERLGKQPALV